jgi:hypothetical protein
LQNICGTKRTAPKVGEIEIDQSVADISVLEVKININIYVRKIERDRLRARILSGLPSEHAAS